MVGGMFQWMFPGYHGLCVSVQKADQVFLLESDEPNTDIDINRPYHTKVWVLGGPQRDSGRWYPSPLDGPASVQQVCAAQALPFVQWFSAWFVREPDLPEHKAAPASCGPNTYQNPGSGRGGPWHELLLDSSSWTAWAGLRTEQTHPHTHTHTHL